MTQKDKRLLIKDLCARLPYGVKVQVCNIIDHTPTVKGVLNNELYVQFDYMTKLINNGDSTYNIIEDNVKPYLRPLWSMTEEEQKELVQFHCITLCPVIINEMLTLNNESDMFD